MATRPRVFLSFTNRDERDKSLAQFLATNLEARGATVLAAALHRLAY